LRPGLRARWLGLVGWLQFLVIIALTVAEKIHETLRVWASDLFDWLRYRVRWKIQEYIQARRS